MKRNGQVCVAVVLSVAIVFVWGFAVPMRRAEAAGWMYPVLGGLGGFPAAGFALASAVCLAGVVAIQSGAVGRVVTMVDSTVRQAFSNWWSSCSTSAQGDWNTAAVDVMGGRGAVVTSSMQEAYDALTTTYMPYEVFSLPTPAGQGWTGVPGSWSPIGTDTLAGAVAAAVLVAKHVSGATLCLVPVDAMHSNVAGNLKSRMTMTWKLFSDVLSTGGSYEWYGESSGGVPKVQAAWGASYNKLWLRWVFDQTEGKLEVPLLISASVGQDWVDCPYAIGDYYMRQWWAYEHKLWPVIEPYISDPANWSRTPADWSIERVGIGDAIPFPYEQDLRDGLVVGPDIAIVPDGTNYRIDGIPTPDDIIGPVPMDPTLSPPSGGDSTGLLSDIKDVLSSLAGAIAAAISGVFVGDFSEVDWSRLEDAMSLASTKFPFCLPWDLGRFAGIFDVAEQAVLPCVNVEWPALLGGGSFTMQIGAGLEGIFSRIKWLLLIVWDIGLINWGRKWWTGGGQG